MQSTDFIAIAPLVILAVTAVSVMLLIAIYRHHAATAALTFSGLTAAFAVLPGAARLAPISVTPLLVVDQYAIFFIGLILAATMITVLLSYGYLNQQNGHREEFYLLLLMAALGSTVLVTSRHFAAFFLGLEILSVSLYALIAYTRFRIRSIEAGIKYLVLAAVSSAFMLYGVALIYADLGVLDFVRIATRIQTSHGGGQSVILLAGLGLVIAAMGFKLAVVPFHMWVPDIYQGAPAPVTGFVASVSKVAMAALLVRLFSPIDLNQSDVLFGIFAALAFASMVIGNILALLQTNIKRLLAYSSIAHMGYLLVAFLAGGTFAVSAVIFYLVAYSISILGCFGVITVLSGKDRDAETLDDFRGLFFRHPWLTAVFTVMLLSLAGIPMTAGFVGKFYIVSAGVGGGLWVLVISLVLTSGIGLFYYLQVLIVIYSRQSGRGRCDELPYGIATPGSLAITVLVVFLFWLGIIPNSFIELIRGMTG
ncbi:MAG: NADH-quinone oxidoreductase subunit N [Desulfobacteraceae bacterium]|nr:NADH-quinone oxidoreductase subunit N [Desulfobacteraceae bacterium]